MKHMSHFKALEITVIILLFPALVQSQKRVKALNAQVAFLESRFRQMVEIAKANSK